MSANSRMAAPSHRSATWPDEIAQRYRALGYWTGDTLHGHLERAAARHPQRTALVCGARRWTHAELQARIRTATAGLRASGIGTGDRILRTTERPAHMAKNRMSLPEELPLDFRVYAEHLGQPA